MLELTLLSLTFRECVSDSDSPRPESLSILVLRPKRTSKFEQSEFEPAVFSDALFRLLLEVLMENEKYVMM